MTALLRTMQDIQAPPDRPELQRLGRNNLGFLHRLLSRFPRSDGYTGSAAYYAMTGRKGLWLYRREDTFMLVAAHPNRDGHLLFFPPIGKHPDRLMAEALGDDRLPATHREIARIAPEDRLLAAWVQASGPIAFDEEHVLDWVCPAHILDTEAVARHEGQAFRDFRQNIARARRRGLTARVMESDADIRHAHILAEAWAGATEHEGYSRADLTAPAHWALDLMQRSALPVHGLMIEDAHDAQGFILWEETAPERRFANSISSLALPGRGTAEFSYLAMAEALADRGFDRVAIGGSETKGLDAFKRKMVPAVTIELESAFFARGVGRSEAVQIRNAATTPSCNPSPVP